MKYLILAAILMSTASSAFAVSAAYAVNGTSKGTVNVSGAVIENKNVSDAQDREDAIKANLDEKSDTSEQKSESTEE